MLDEQKRSLGPNSLKKSPFQESNWNRIVDDVAKRTGTTKYSKQRLKGKIKQMKHLFNKFTDLIKKSGFGWDKELGTVTAPDEVWEDYIERNPDAVKFRDKGLPHYELLKELYSPSVATGELNRSSSRGAPESDDERDVRMSLSQGQVGASSGSRKRKSQECDSKAVEKTKKNELLEILGNYLDLRTKQLQGEGAQDQQSNEDRYSIPAAIDLLNEFVNYILPTIYLKALDMFMMSADVRQT
ncbi:hypothetical protein Vadar_031026 [Vaccinium darrowii]|uniref:Uncharacterized protein n=1 Tax=Vaccinium darrowii TaxID=229202 RepID=A0ACB7XL68_9ERIC|nr:hypothetical protein Vadar_031026 [Vaccinium darrowii]